MRSDGIRRGRLQRMTRRYHQKWPQLELEVKEARAMSTQPMFITTLRLYRKEKGALLFPTGALS